MPVKVNIPQAMRQHADGQATVELAGANIKEVLDDLGAKFPNITGRIFENGQLRRFVNIYLNDEDIRYLDNLQSATKDGDVVAIIPPLPEVDMNPTPDPADSTSSEVPDGAAVFPLIPDELGIHPLLLAAIHSVVFFDGSDADVVNDAAANESLNYIATYLQRLQGADLKRIHEDMDCLIAFGKQEGWPKEEMQFLQEFLKEFGVGQG